MSKEERDRCNEHQEKLSDVLQRLVKIELWLKVLAGVIVSTVAPGAAKNIAGLFGGM